MGVATLFHVRGLGLCLDPFLTVYTYIAPGTGLLFLPGDESRRHSVVTMGLAADARRYGVQISRVIHGRILEKVCLFSRK